MNNAIIKLNRSITILKKTVGDKVDKEIFGIHRWAGSFSRNLNGLDDLNGKFEKAKEKVEEGCKKIKRQTKVEIPNRIQNGLDDMKGNFEKVKEKVEEGC